MNKIFSLLLILLASTVFAQQTPNLGLNIPARGVANWDTLLNTNFTQLDRYLSGGLTLPGDLTVAGNITCSTGCTGITIAGDLSGNGTTQQVIGILGHILPTLSAGCLNYTGSAFNFTSCGAASVTGTGTSTQVAVFSGSTVLTSYSGFTTDSSGNVTVTSLSTNGSGAGRIKMTSGTYASLNSSNPCNSTNKDIMSTISDASTQVWGATVSGGGTPGLDTVVFCDGTNWTVMGK